MPNSASQEANLSLPEKPEDMMSYDEYWRKNNMYGTSSPDDQILVKFLNFFTGEGNRVKGDYDAYVQNYEQRYQDYLNDLNRYYEAKATQSARAWDAMMSNSQYSRTFDDLAKAGINPYMLLQSGSVSPASYSSSAKADYKGASSAVSRSSLKNSKSDTKGRDFALILLAIARLMAAM